jgi:hypothetical protein
VNAETPPLMNCRLVNLIAGLLTPQSAWLVLSTGSFAIAPDRSRIVVWRMLSMVGRSRIS